MGRTVELVRAGLEADIEVRRSQAEASRGIGLSCGHGVQANVWASNSVAPAEKDGVGVFWGEA